MGDFTKITADAIRVLNNMADLLENAETNDDKFAYIDNVSFKGRTYKIRVNFNKYPEYLAVEMMQEI